MSVSQARAEPRVECSGRASRESCARRPRGRSELSPSDLLAAFFVPGVAFIVAAVAVAGVHAAGGLPEGRRIAFHLAFVGGISQLVLGASQFFAGAFLATSPPPRALVRGQLGAWNGGTLLVVLGLSASWPVATAAGGAALLLGLALFAAGLRSLQRASLRRAPWATRWYRAGAALLALGAVAGAWLGAEQPWPYGSLLGAHMTLNVAGWFGAAIVGTLHTFYPSLTGTHLRFPRLQPPTFAAWVVGVLLLAGGYGFGVDAAVVAGWGALAAGAALLAANLAASALGAERPLSLSARLVGLAQGLLLAGLFAAAVTTLTDGATAAVLGEERAGVAALLLAGWLGLTVLGALLHLLSVLLRVRGLTRALPEPRPLRDGALAALAVAGVLGVAVSRLLPLDALLLPAGAVLVVVYALLLTRIAALAVRAVVHGGLRV